jgi:hypothetical protein
MTSKREPLTKSEFDSVGAKKLSPMAFTVDFGEASEKKGFGIADSISKFAPRHRKNLSLTKIEDIIGREKEKERVEKKDEPQPQSKLLKKVAPSSHSAKLFSAQETTSRELGEVKEKDKDKVPFRKTLSSQQAMLAKPKASVLPTQSVIPVASMKDLCNNNLLDYKQNNSRGDSNCKAASLSIPPDAEDSRSETGTYTIDDSAEEVVEARENIDSIFGTHTGPRSSPTKGTDIESRVAASNSELEWVREWAESAAQQQQSPTRGKSGGESYFIHI